MRTNVLVLRILELRSRLLKVGSCVLFCFGVNRTHQSPPISGDSYLNESLGDLNKMHVLQH